jgi:hypothetical protein
MRTADFDQLPYVPFDAHDQTPRSWNYSSRSPLRDSGGFPTSRAGSPYLDRALVDAVDHREQLGLGRGRPIHGGDPALDHRGSDPNSGRIREFSNDRYVASVEGLRSGSCSSSEATRPQRRRMSLPSARSRARFRGAPRQGPCAAFLFLEGTRTGVVCEVPAARRSPGSKANRARMDKRGRPPAGYFTKRTAEEWAKSCSWERLIAEGRRSSDCGRCRRFFRIRTGLSGP